MTDGAYRFLALPSSGRATAAAVAGGTADEQVGGLVVARIAVDVVGLAHGPAARRVVQRPAARLALAGGAADGGAASAMVRRVAVAGTARITGEPSGFAGVCLAGLLAGLGRR